MPYLGGERFVAKACPWDRRTTVPVRGQPVLFERAGHPPDIVKTSTAAHVLLLPLNC